MLDTRHHHAERVYSAFAVWCSNGHQTAMKLKLTAAAAALPGTRANHAVSLATCHALSVAPPPTTVTRLRGFPASGDRMRTAIVGRTAVAIGQNDTDPRIVVWPPVVAVLDARIVKETVPNRVGACSIPNACSVCWYHRRGAPRATKSMASSWCALTCTSRE